MYKEGFGSFLESEDCMALPAKTNSVFKLGSNKIWGNFTDLNKTISTSLVIGQIPVEQRAASSGANQWTFGNGEFHEGPQSQACVCEALSPLESQKFLHWLSIRFLSYAVAYFPWLGGIYGQTWRGGSFLPKLVPFQQFLLCWWRRIFCLCLKVDLVGSYLRTVDYSQSVNMGSTNLLHLLV